MTTGALPEEKVEETVEDSVEETAQSAETTENDENV